jgi:dipeptidyl aminopeptidase/acylaminoacyl peptidase
MDRPGLESDKLHLEIFNLATNTPMNITGFWDRSVKDYSWVNNNQILLLATDIGVDKVYLFDINRPQGISCIVEDLASTLGLMKVTENLYVLQRSSYVSPDDLFLLQLDPRSLNQLTNLNPQLSNFASSTPELFFFKGGYGDTVQGWILRPINFVPSQKYPVAFLIHGGPEGAWESSWSYRWNPQLWTARGYAVVMVNPHGSSGQGQKFTDAVRDDWGGVPYFDLMTGLDYALSTYSFLDGNRACALGASYGGYMVNWIQGQTDRFKCLVTHDGVFSTLTMFYATEELWFPMAEYCPLNAVGCKPWEDQYRERYLKFSPEANVASWKTPHLVIHGSNDFRIPVSEGISVFTALQLRGIPSRFLHFTQENHWVLRPENSIKWYEEVLGWIDTYTKTTTKLPLKFLEDKQ